MKKVRISTPYMRPYWCSGKRSGLLPQRCWVRLPENAWIQLFARGYSDKDTFKVGKLILIKS
jgi:hypothetical protein